MAAAHAQAMRCVLPVSLTRRLPGQVQAMAVADVQITRLLPAARIRGAQGDLRASALEAAGLSCQLPAGVARAETLGLAMAAAGEVDEITRLLPQPVARAATLDAAMPGIAPVAGLAPSGNPASAGGSMDGRPDLPLGAMLRIVERVARGISGAAGYAYIGEDPQGAGLRFGALGFRLDTGDMGGVMRLALMRDHAAVEAALGEGAQDVIAAVLAGTSEARRAPVHGALLWSPHWKAVLSRTATLDVFRAAQNEYAVELLLRPAAILLAEHPSLGLGTALAMALDVLAEAGREAGFAALAQALATGGSENVAALRERLAFAVPPSGARLSGLMQDRQLADWRPDPAGTA